MNDPGLRPLVTDVDDARLRALMGTSFGRAHEGMMLRLLEKLDRCRVVPARTMPASVVTMGSRITCWGDAGGTRELVLTHPGDASPAAGRVSVLSPLGIQLLGAIPGYVFRTGGSCFSIVDVTHEPEAEQQFNL